MKVANFLKIRNYFKANESYHEAVGECRVGSPRRDTEENPIYHKSLRRRVFYSAVDPSNPTLMRT